MNKRLAVKKLSPLLLFYLALALVGSITLSIGETNYIENYGTGKQNHTGFTIINYNFDCLAENPGFLANVYRNSNLSRNGIIQVFMLAGMSAAMICFSLFTFYRIKNNNISNYRNTILLKLRIWFFSVIFIFLKKNFKTGVLSWEIYSVIFLIYSLLT